MSRSDTRNQDTQVLKNVAVKPLEHGFRMELSDLMGVLYSGSDKGGADVQHIIMGTFHTYNKELYAKLGSDEVVKSLAENAVMNLFLEYPKDRQPLVSAFLDAAQCGEEVEPGSFAEEFREGKIKSFFNDPDDWDVPGAKSNSDTIKFVNESLIPFIVKAKCGGIESYMVDDQRAAKIKLAEYDAAVKKGDVSEYMKLGKEFLLMRHEDVDIASLTNKEAGDEKSLTVLGMAHGSLAKDLDELLAGENGERRVLKIDVAANFEVYRDEYGATQLEGRMHRFVPEFGEDPPDLVYLAEEGMCLTTENTPQYVMDALESKGVKFVPVGDLYSQNMVNKEVLLAQEDGKDLSLDAFV